MSDSPLRPPRALTRLLPTTEAGWEVLLPCAVVVGLVSGVSAAGLRSGVHALFHALQPLRDSLKHLRGAMGRES